ncbi:ParA family protein [Holdemania massiliensis]|uniref:ParA family protein n=1 Tax=Holdemania massiliensis TaxID=1468449 RepID=UPI001F05ABF1|nr:AAA family ATPase [Holdemania massiliensis]MCH1942444.1 AAA family ATPase [Holdemania massiliensis]
MEVITIVNFKGGTGKSETTRNLAKGNAEKGKRVLVIGNDPQGDITKALSPTTSSISKIDLSAVVSENELIHAILNHINYEVELSDLYLQPKKIKEAIIHTDIENLDIIPSTLNLSNSEIKIRSDATMPQHNRISMMLREVKNDYDLVLIDCAPALNLLTINAICATTSKILIPLKIDEGGLSGWALTVQLIHKICEGYGLDIDYVVLFTMVQKTSHGWLKECDQIIKSFSRILGKKVFKTVIRNQAKGVLSAGFKKDFTIDGKSGVSEDYRNLVEELDNYIGG